MSRPFTLGRLETMYLKGDFHQHFIRHDVDYSLEAALAMGRWEESYGYHSTFYLMEDSPFYSNDDACFALKELNLMGHDGGIHVDERKGSSLLDLITRLEGLKVSFHCPTPNVLWRDWLAIHSAYASMWKGRYWADSNGTFRFGDPEDQKWFGDDMAARQQINLHPEWWFERGWHKRISDDDWAAFFYGAPKPDAWIPSQYG